MDNYRNTMEENKISENLVHTMSMSIDETMVYLNISYLDGKFSIEKSFKNNYFGLEELNLTIKELDTEDKVRSYLRLGEQDGK